MFNIFRPKKLRRGDLVEIALTSDAKRYLGVYESYAAIDMEEPNFSERFVSGYVAEIEEHYIDLSLVFDKKKKEPAENSRIRVYRSAIKNYRKK